MDKLDQLYILFIIAIIGFILWGSFGFREDNEIKKLRKASQEEKKMWEEHWKKMWEEHWKKMWEEHWKKMWEEHWKKIKNDENYIKIMKLCELSEGRLKLCSEDFGTYWHLEQYHDNGRIIPNTVWMGGDLEGIMYFFEQALGKENIEKLTKQ